jgi:tetratricopeptide (TPR) repeat protein/DNA-binding CsgD family transcriptional regulator
MFKIKGKKKFTIWFLGILFLGNCQWCNAQLVTEVIAVKEDTAYVNKLLHTSSGLFRKDNAQSLLLAKQALQISKKINYNTGIAKSYYATGNTYNIFAQLDAAKENYKDALVYAKKANDSTVMQLCYTSLGIVHSKLDDYENAIAYYQQSVALSEALHDDIQISKSYNGISLVMIKIKQYDQWNIYSSKAVEKAVKANNPFYIMLAFHDKGAAYHRMGREQNNITWYDSALLYYRKAQQLLLHTLSAAETASMLYISQNDMGSLFLEQRQYDSARFYLEQALAGAKKQNSISIICSIYNDLGQIATVDKEYKKATAYLAEAIIMAEKISFERKRSVYKSLTGLAIAMGDYKNAVMYQAQMMNSKDSLYNTEKATAVNNLNIKYDTKQKELKIEQLKRENTLQNRVKYFAIALALAGLAALVLLARSYRLQKKVNTQNVQLLKEEKGTANLLKKQFENEREKTLLNEKLKEEEKFRFESELAVKKLQEETLQKEIAHMQRELSIYVLQTEKKNELITTLQSRLKEIELQHAATVPQLKDIYKLLDKTLEVENDFDKFSFHFQKVHPLFFQQLQQLASNNLTPLDLKYCAYMKMNLSAKEIANLLNVGADSIRVTRHRLKQKLNLEKDDDLINYLLKI